MITQEGKGPLTLISRLKAGGPLVYSPNQLVFWICICICQFHGKYQKQRWWKTQQRNLLVPWVYHVGHFEEKKSLSGKRQLSQILSALLPNLSSRTRKEKKRCFLNSLRFNIRGFGGFLLWSIWSTPLSLRLKLNWLRYELTWSECLEKLKFDLFGV